LNAFERDFGEKVLASKEARMCFRHWRKTATTKLNAWSAIRKATFSAAGKEIYGSILIAGLRKQLVAAQAGRCCYCRNQLEG
ncbi:hypothetical protein ACQXW1_17760, partial [Lactiplantibacillus pentosus]